LRRLLPPPAKILELGCGHGFLTHSLIESGYVVDTIDAAFKAPSGIRSHFIADLQQGLPLEHLDRNYDGVVSLASLHHVLQRPDQLPHTLSSGLIEVTRPGSVLVIQDVAQGDPIEARSFLVERFFREVVDVYSHPPHEGVYLDLPKIADSLERGEWTILEISIRPCDWHFSSEKDASGYFHNLFNLQLSDEQLLRALKHMLYKNEEGKHCARWALGFLLLERGE